MIIHCKSQDHIKWGWNMYNSGDAACDEPYPYRVSFTYFQLQPRLESSSILFTHIFWVQQQRERCRNHNKSKRGDEIYRIILTKFYIWDTVTEPGEMNY